MAILLYNNGNASVLSNWRTVSELSVTSGGTPTSYSSDTEVATFTLTDSLVLEGFAIKIAASSLNTIKLFRDAEELQSVSSFITNTGWYIVGYSGVLTPGDYSIRVVGDGNVTVGEYILVEDTIPTELHSQLYVLNGANLTWDLNSEEIFDIDLATSGVLKFATATGDYKLRLGWFNFYGTVNIGAPGVFYPSVNTATIELTHDVEVFGTLALYGQQKMGWTFLASDITAGAMTLTVNNLSGWEIDDEIHIGPSLEISDNETKTITNISSNTISCSAFTYDHPKTATEVANLNRNVKVTTSNESSLIFQNTATFQYIMFEGLGIDITLGAITTCLFKDCSLVSDATISNSTLIESVVSIETGTVQNNLFINCDTNIESAAVSFNGNICTILGLHMLSSVNSFNNNTIHTSGNGLTIDNLTSMTLNNLKTHHISDIAVTLLTSIGSILINGWVSSENAAHFKVNLNYGKLKLNNLNWDGLNMDYGWLLDGSALSNVEITNSNLETTNAYMLGTLNVDTPSVVAIKCLNSKLGENPVVGASNLLYKSHISSDTHEQVSGDYAAWQANGYNIGNKFYPLDGTKYSEFGEFGVLVYANDAPYFSIKLRKSTDYLGDQPQFVLKADPALGINGDTVLDTMSESNDVWETLVAQMPTSLSYGIYKCVVRCRGTAGYVEADTFSSSAIGRDDRGMMIPWRGQAEALVGNNVLVQENKVAGTFVLNQQLTLSDSGTLLIIKAPANATVRIDEIRISVSDTIDPEQMLIGIFSVLSLAEAVGDALTVNPVDSNPGSSKTIIYKNLNHEPIYDDPYHVEGCSTAGGFHYLGDRIILSTNKSLGIRLLSTPSIAFNVECKIVYTEMGG